MADHESGSAAPHHMTNSAFNLRAAFLRGSAWTILGMGSGQALRFAKSLLLTRLLFPETYGVMAIVWSFMYAINMLSDAGLETAALRHEKGDQAYFLNTVWTAKIIRGTFLFLLSCVLAYPISRIYNMSSLVWLLPLAGCTSLIEGLSSTNIYLLKRQMQFRRLSVLEISGEILMAVVTIAWATWFPGYMALLGGALFGALFHMVCSHIFLPGARNRLEWNVKASTELFHFGKWVLFSSIIYMIYSQGDRILLGLYVEPATLGIYSVAIMMSEVAGGVVSRLNSSVVYPTLTRIQNEGAEKIKSILKKIRLIFDATFVLPIGILAAISPLLIESLYDKRYHAAGWMLQILCVRLVMTTMLASSDSALIAIGKPKYGLYQNISRTVWLLAAVPLGFYFWELKGILCAIAGTEIVATLILWFGLRREGLFTPWNELRSSFAALLGFGVGLLLLQLHKLF